MNVSISNSYTAFKNIFADRILAISFFSILCLLFVGIFTILFSYRNLPPFIPLYNQMPWGESRLTSKIYLLFLPLTITIIIFIGNSITSSYLYKKVPLLSRLLSLTTLLITFLALLFIIRTIYIVL